jgi:hypothetical protein
MPLCDAGVKSLSGYFNIKSERKELFLLVFESRAEPSNDPLIIWLTGRPGCSSQMALLSENGPCTPTPNGFNTLSNPYSWNTNANISGLTSLLELATATETRGFDHNETEVSEDLYSFLQEFFTAHGEYLTCLTSSMCLARATAATMCLLFLLVSTKEIRPRRVCTST